MDFLRARLASLKEDNDILQETKGVTDERLRQCERKAAANADAAAKLADATASALLYQTDMKKAREQGAN